MTRWQGDIDESLQDYTTKRSALVSALIALRLDPPVPHLDPMLRLALDRIESDSTTDPATLAAVRVLADAAVPMLAHLSKLLGNQEIVDACRLWQRTVKAPRSNTHFENRLRKATDYEEADPAYFVTGAVIRLLRCPYYGKDIRQPNCEIVWRVVDIALVTTVYRQVCGDKKADTAIAILAEALAA